MNSGAVVYFVSRSGEVLFLWGGLAHLRPPRWGVVLLARPVTGGLGAVTHAAVFERPTHGMDRIADWGLRISDSLSAASPKSVQRPKIKYAITAPPDSRRAWPGEVLRRVCWAGRGSLLGPSGPFGPSRAPKAPRNLKDRKPRRVCNAHRFDRAMRKVCGAHPTAGICADMCMAERPTKSLVLWAAEGIMGAATELPAW